MALTLYWFLPSHGDGRGLGRRGAASAPQRAPDLVYLTQVACAADQLGFAGMLVPTGLFCEDPWLLSAALAERTGRVRFMVAVRPSLLSPLVAAQMAATAQRLTGNRLDLNVVTGGDPDEQGRYGSWLDHEQRYAQTAEFLSIVNGVWSGMPFDFSGTHFRVERALLSRPPEVPPTIFVGGSSAEARRVAARFAEVYLAWGESPASMAEMFADVRGLAATFGRDPRFGTRFHVICRDTTDEAWAVARRLIADLDPALVAAAQARVRKSDSVGQQRMAALHGGQADQLEVYPNVWAGYGLVRPGAGAALVGSYQQVADRIEEFYRSGATYLILSGQPHLEEAYSFGEGVMPLLRARGLIEADGQPEPARPAAARPGTPVQATRAS
jgi:alkanesulfonate monooxygenase